MERATALANLTIHTLDPVGVETEATVPRGSSTGIHERQDDLRLLADMTGGRTVMNTGARKRIPDVFAESNSFYLLAFAPAIARPMAATQDRGEGEPAGRQRADTVGAFRRRDRVADSKPSVVSPERPRHLEGVLPHRSPLSVSGSPLAMPGREESAVAVVLGVRQQVPRDRSEASEPVKVLAAAFDRNGRSVHSEEQTVGIALPSNSAGDFSYEVLSRLTLKPGRYEIRVALDAAPTPRASSTYVDVPNFRISSCHCPASCSAHRRHRRRCRRTRSKISCRLFQRRSASSRAATMLGLPPHLPGVEGCASAGRRDGANRGHERPRPDEGCRVVRIRAVRIKPRRGLSTRTAGRAIGER
jgi:hypothetical protein